MSSRKISSTTVSNKKTTTTSNKKTTTMSNKTNMTIVSNVSDIQKAVTRQRINSSMAGTMIRNNGGIEPTSERIDLPFTYGTPIRNLATYGTPEVVVTRHDKTATTRKNKAHTAKVKATLAKVDAIADRIVKSETAQVPAVPAIAPLALDPVRAGCPLLTMYRAACDAARAARHAAMEKDNAKHDAELASAKARAEAHRTRLSWSDTPLTSDASKSGERIWAEYAELPHNAKRLADIAKRRDAKRKDGCMFVDDTPVGTSNAASVDREMKDGEREQVDLSAYESEDSQYNIDNAPRVTTVRGHRVTLAGGKVRKVRKYRNSHHTYQQWVNEYAKKIVNTYIKTGRTAPVDKDGKRLEKKGTLRRATAMDRYEQGESRMNPLDHYNELVWETESVINSFLWVRVNKFPIRASELLARLVLGIAPDSTVRALYKFGYKACDFRLRRMRHEKTMAPETIAAFNVYSEDDNNRDYGWLVLDGTLSLTLLDGQCDRIRNAIASVVAQRPTRANRKSANACLKTVDMVREYFVASIDGEEYKLPGLEALRNRMYRLAYFIHQTDEGAAMLRSLHRRKEHHTTARRHVPMCGV